MNDLDKHISAYLSEDHVVRIQNKDTIAELVDKRVGYIHEALKGYAKKAVFLGNDVDPYEVEAFAVDTEQAAFIKILDAIENDDMAASIRDLIDTKGFFGFAVWSAHKQNLPAKARRKYPTYEKDDAVIFEQLEAFTNDEIVTKLRNVTSNKRTNKDDKSMISDFIKLHGETEVRTAMLSGIKNSDVRAFETSSHDPMDVKRVLKRALFKEVIDFVNPVSIDAELAHQDIDGNDIAVPDTLVADVSLPSGEDILHMIAAIEALSDFKRAAFLLYHMMFDQPNDSTSFKDLARTAGISSYFIEKYSPRIEGVLTLRDDARKSATGIRLSDVAHMLGSTEQKIRARLNEIREIIIEAILDSSPELS